jgi:hypothetical protein
MPLHLDQAHIRMAVWRVLLVLASIAIAEVALQLVSFVSPAARELLGFEGVSNLVPDDALGLRGNPRFADHDVAGYRNHDRPRQSAIVVLGDSQAYGTSVHREQAWPHQLEGLLGRGVYNMALPGYGPAHALLQMDEALSLDPKHIIVSVYFGNDFFDASALSMRNGQISALAPSALMHESRVLEDQRKLADEVDALFRREDRTAQDAPLQSDTVARLRAWMSSHSRLYGLARAAKRIVRGPDSSLLANDFETAVRGLTPAERRYCLVVDGPAWRTILTPLYRARVIDDSDVRIRQGVEVVKRALESMATQSHHAGIDFLVVLMPTKETVFWPHTDQADGELSRLVTDETRLKEELVHYLESRDVEYVDMVDWLRKVDRQPYFENADGHPNEYGHRVVADVVARRLTGRESEPRYP